MLSRDAHLGIIEVRNTEAVLGWTRNTFYSGLISALFWFVFTHFTFATPSYSLVCVGGALLSIFWLAAALRTKELMSYWNKQLSHLETADRDISGISVFAGHEFKGIENKRMTHHNLLLFLIGIVIATWLGLAVSPMYGKYFPKSQAIPGGYSHGHYKQVVRSI
jgi:hypothetical protein